MEQIEIMPRMEGTGRAGTRELLSTATPLLAALNLTPVGKGILGAVATLSMIPEESEAGVFNIMKRRATDISKLVDEGVAVFPDYTRNAEFNTVGFASTLRRNNKNPKNLADYLELPENFRTLARDEIEELAKAKQRIYETPMTSKSDEALAAQKAPEPSVGETTAGYYQFPNQSEPTGAITVRNSKSPEHMADTLTHECTHCLDWADKDMRKIMEIDPDKMHYMFDLSETRAFNAGYRGRFDETLTNPASEDFVHPLISYGGGEFSNQPTRDYVTNMGKAMEAQGKTFKRSDSDAFVSATRAEVKRLQEKVNSDPIFKAKMDKATTTTAKSNAEWVMTFSQQKALASAQKKIFE